MAATVAALVDAGAERAEAVATVANRTLQPIIQVEQTLAAREHHLAAAEKLERHMAIARGLKAGDSHRTIGARLGLHQKSVARIAVRLKRKGWLK
jgi:DNA-binding NarL/FixJ family response regulator